MFILILYVVKNEKVSMYIVLWQWSHFLCLVSNAVSDEIETNFKPHKYYVCEYNTIVLMMVVFTYCLFHSLKESLSMEQKQVWVTNIY